MHILKTILSPAIFFVLGVVMFIILLEMNSFAAYVTNGGLVGFVSATLIWLALLFFAVTVFTLLIERMGL